MTGEFTSFEDERVPGWLPMCTDGMKYVVQSNEMIMARQSLSINAAKLIRLAIMQIKPSTDEIFDGYFISVSELSETLGVPSQNLYRDLDKITDEIMTSFLEFKREDEGGKDGSFSKIAWASRCDYVKKKGIFIRLNRALEPYLVGLKKFYTQYTFMEISRMKSIYAVRIYEMLNAKIDGDVFPKDGRNVVVTLDEIYEACKIDSDSYNRISDFKINVLDRAVKDINRCTMYDVKYSDIKDGRKIVGFNFNILRDNIKALFIGREERERKYRRECTNET